MNDWIDFENEKPVGKAIAMVTYAADMYREEIGREVQAPHMTFAEKQHALALMLAVTDKCNQVDDVLVALLLLAAKTGVDLEAEALDNISLGAALMLKEETGHELKRPKDLDAPGEGDWLLETKPAGDDN